MRAWVLLPLALRYQPNISSSQRQSLTPPSCPSWLITIASMDSLKSRYGLCDSTDMAVAPPNAKAAVDVDVVSGGALLLVSRSSCGLSSPSSLSATAACGFCLLLSDGCLMSLQQEASSSSSVSSAGSYKSRSERRACRMTASASDSEASSEAVDTELSKEEESPEKSTEEQAAEFKVLS